MPYIRAHGTCLSHLISFRVNTWFNGGEKRKRKREREGEKNRLKLFLLFRCCVVFSIIWLVIWSKSIGFKYTFSSVHLGMHSQFTILNLVFNIHSMHMSGLGRWSKWKTKKTKKKQQTSLKCMSLGYIRT